jgi:hypothetical protein
MSLTSRSGRVIRAPEKFTYDDWDKIVVGKDERKYRDPEDLQCESDSDDDSAGSLAEFITSDAESVTEPTATDDEEEEFKDNESETDTETEPPCETDEEDDPLPEPEDMDIDE